MRRAEAERQEEKSEEVEVESVAAEGLVEGDRAIIAAKKRSKFLKRYNGLECFIVSRHRSSAIVEVLKYKELIVCQIENLRPATARRLAATSPAGSGRSR